MSTDLTLDLADPRDQKTYYFTMTPARQAITAGLGLIFATISARQVRGLHHLPAQGPVVLAANHLTQYDVIPMQLALPRPVFFMGKAELFRHPVMDWALRQLGGFPVHRGGGDAWALQHARRVLEKGQILGIFPEGTRSRGRGLGPARTGAARLAQEMNAPLVPVGVHGPQYMFRHFPRRTPITVTVGHPIFPAAGESPAALTDRLMFALAALLPPEMRGAYATGQVGLFSAAD